MQKNMTYTTAKIFGYQIFNSSLDTLWEERSFFEYQHHPTFVACANPHSLVVASRDPLFQEALKRSDVLLPDGSGIILAARILKVPMEGKIAGADFFLGLMRQLNLKGGKRVFFLGSTERVLGLIKEKVHKEFPGVTVCGTHSPPFAEQFSREQNDNMIQAVNEAHPDVLWVGMTAPKQEKWIYQNLDRLNVPIVGAIGAVFDFYAGTKKRSSDIWIRLGLEWLPRFLKEPQRLWERNLKSTPIFLWWIFREKLRQRSSSHAC